MMTKKTALQRLSAEFGTPISALLEEYVFDSVQPGCCMQCGNVVDDCEPDATENWCSECDEASVHSISVLCEVI